MTDWYTERRPELESECPRCGCPTACPEGRYEAGRAYGLGVGALLGVLCSAVVVFVIGMIAWLA